MSVSVVIPNWNGREWLPACLRALASQEHAPAEVIVVDNGSEDGSVQYLRAEHPAVRVLALGTNTGFAHAANRGLEAAENDFVALVNTDVVLDGDWLARTSRTLTEDRGAAAVACKMLSLTDPGRVYDAGDILRRDGACEQRGRYMRDDGRWDHPGTVFGACAGAALYRRSIVLELGGFDERYFAYLEDADLALRLGLTGWRCRYEPAVALHAGEGSSHRLRGGHQFFVTRNTLVLVAKAFPLRWLPFVAYRQLAWAWHATRERRLASHLRALAAAVPLLPGVLRERRALLSEAAMPVEVVVPWRPFRGRRAGGHSAQRTWAAPGSLRGVPSRTTVAAARESVTGASCAWCGAAAIETTPPLARCSVCGASTTFPAPSEDELERAYATWYRPADGRFGAGGDRLLRFSRAALARRLDRVAPPGPILDVGAGDGTLVRALRARGREALGLERVAGDGVRAAEIETFDDRAGQWAAVVFWHSLEHLRDPAAAVDRAVALLVPGGVLAIAVPNLSSWQARCFGERWFHLDWPRHLVHLPASTLQTGVRARGLAIERTSYWRGGQILFGWLHGIVGMLPGRPDLYSAIRRVGAQDAPVVGPRRLAVLASATAVAPAAAALAVAEISVGAGGTVYIEARRA